MVRKLIKYDFQSFYRLLFPVQMILIGIAALNRIIQLFEKTDSVVYSITFGSSIALFVISAFALLLMTVIVSIIRFYQGLYSGEGYLSHTLPVTPTQHIIAKTLTSFLFILGALLALFISFMVITLGDVNIECFKAAGYIIKDYFRELGFQGAVYVVEFLALMLVACFTMLMKLYFCISVGQLVSRKKILLAFGVYFGLYILSQAISTIVIIIVTLNPAWVEAIAEWLTLHSHAAVHIYFLGGLVIQAILGAVYFFVVKHIMTKKLNLT